MICEIEIISKKNRAPILCSNARSKAHPTKLARIAEMLPTIKEMPVIEASTMVVKLA
jgi:hypothetical protein